MRLPTTQSSKTKSAKLGKMDCKIYHLLFVDHSGRSSGTASSQQFEATARTQADTGDGDTRRSLWKVQELEGKYIYFSHHKAPLGSLSVPNATHRTQKERRRARYRCNRKCKEDLEGTLLDHSDSH
jgi:hypothetical protein